MINVIRGTTKKPASSEQLATLFERKKDLNGFLYIGYPIIATLDGPHPIDALLISEEKGIVIFQLIEGIEIVTDIKTRADENANKIEARLRLVSDLMKGRELQIPINIVYFAPKITNLPNESDDYSYCNEQNIDEVINSLPDWSYNSLYNKLISTIQLISSIRTNRIRREIIHPESRGAKLKRLEDSIANLDRSQSQAVIETVTGVQRIRGLAGSGKTIVLALKAAYLHATYPDWKIAVTFNTRSLKGQFKRLIRAFFYEQTFDEPDWQKLSILHAWGAPGSSDKNGIYYQVCTAHGIEYLDFGLARNKFPYNGQEFDEVCKKALNEINTFKPLYDCILVDEAQDFSSSFLNICYNTLTREKRLVYAYDELQNLSNSSLQPPEELFGVNQNGEPKVSFEYDSNGHSRQDLILNICYRNSRPVLATAHALGFGIYRDTDPKIGTGIIQIFENKNLWKEIGYDHFMPIEDGREIILERSTISSPLFLERDSDLSDLVSFSSFKTYEEQANWLLTEIKKNIEEDELRPEDIIVINPNPFTTKKNVAFIRQLLFNAGINSHLTGVDTSPDVFFKEESDSIAFTGIYRAKGNEAGMVYVINAEECYSSTYNLSIHRNRLFTAITRSKAWVRVLGVGPEMDELLTEFNRIKENDFKLKFVYPTEEQRKHLNIVNREVPASKMKKIDRRKVGVKELIDDLEKGEIFIEDLDDDARNKLLHLLAKKK